MATVKETPLSEMTAEYEPYNRLEETRMTVNIKAVVSQDFRNVPTPSFSDISRMRPLLSTLEVSDSREAVRTTSDIGVAKGQLPCWLRSGMNHRLYMTHCATVGPAFFKESRIYPLEDSQALCASTLVSLFLAVST